jgi:hypothetical protein
MRKLFVGFFSVVTLALISLSPVRADTSHLVISSVKTDGSGTAEYVELTNTSQDSVTLAADTWTIEYAKPITATGYTFTYPDCASAVWHGNTTRVVPASIIASHGKIGLTIPMNDDVGGAVRLIETNSDGSQTVRDVVGWGSLSSLATCAEKSQTNIPKTNQVLSRCLAEGLPSDTNDNAADFRVIQTTDTVADCDPPSADPPAQTSSCAGIQISELLPDPPGDTGNGGEFVELHNPTLQPIPLTGCQLYIGSTYSQHMTLPDIELAVDQYQALPFEETGLQLSNAAGRAKVLDSDGAVISESDPYGAIPEGTAWALIQGVWQVTEKPTPNAANELVVTNPGQGGGPTTATDESCPEGKFRNPETNRCKNIAATASELAPCAADQERNPDTGRCRKLASLASSLTPCQPGQERNPDTNRCRKITTAEDALKPCQAGYERNIETNRCRKAAPAIPTKSAGDVAKQPFSIAGLPLSMTWIAVGALGAGAAGYGVYEWRSEVGKAWQFVRRKLFGDNTTDN